MSEPNYIGCRVSHWTHREGRTDDGVVDRQSKTSIWVGDLRLVKSHHWHRYGDKWGTSYDVETPDERNLRVRREMVNRVVDRLRRTPTDKLEAIVTALEASTMTPESEHAQALVEIEALRRQVAELVANGVSIHKAAARAAKAERAAIVAWLRAQPVGMGTIWSASYAMSIERGDHEEGR